LPGGKKIMPAPKEYLSYEEARKKMRTFGRKKGIKSARHFWRIKASELPQGVPANPYRAYQKKSGPPINLRHFMGLE